MRFAPEPATPAPPAPTPPPSAPTPPAPPPAAAAPVKPAPVAVSPPTSPSAAPTPLEGSVSDSGAVRHDSLRILEWSVRGASKVLGDATVGFARLHGMVTVGGRLSATDVTARGTLNVLGTTEVAHRLEVRGTARFSASVRSVEFLGDGRTFVEGDLRAGSLADLSGHTRLTGNCAAGSLMFHGVLSTPGTIHLTGDLHGTLFGGPSRVGTIEAQRIDILRPRFPPWRTVGDLQALRIEGTEIHLEGVVAEFVKGDAIYLGPGCRISRTEGPVVERHKDAFVGPSAVSEGIPAGLWR